MTKTLIIPLISLPSVHFTSNVPKDLMGSLSTILLLFTSMPHWAFSSSLISLLVMEPNSRPPCPA